MSAKCDKFQSNSIDMLTECDEFESNKENIDPQIELIAKLFNLQITPNMSLSLKTSITDSSTNTRIAPKRPLDLEDSECNINENSKHLRKSNGCYDIPTNDENKQP